MFARLIARNPDQDADEHFNYLDVYNVARSTFKGNHLLDMELEDPWDELQNSRSSWMDHAFEC